MAERSTPDPAAIASKWRAASRCPGELLLVTHRGAFMRDSEVILAENSIPAITRALDLGCDVVEIDVRFTRDHTAVVLHDATLDRTTDRNGELAGFNYAEIRDTRLVSQVTGTAFNANLPTLEEVLDAVGDTMMVNVECKTGPTAIPVIAKVAAAAGKLGQTMVKTHINTAAELADVVAILERMDTAIDYVPVIDDARHADLAFVEQQYAALRPNCVECLVRLPPVSGMPCTQVMPLTPDGGLLFSPAARALAADFDARLFINTLYADPFKPASQWNGGRHDQLGRLVPDAVYSFWAAHGATIMQTDEPEFVLAWMLANGFRK